MASIKLDSKVRYLTVSDGLEWRPEDHTASKIVKTVKGQPINGHFYVNCTHGRKRFDNSNAEDFRTLIINTVAHRIKTTIGVNLCIVPIPNKSGIFDINTTFPTFELARKIASKVNSRTQVKPLLWWDEAIQSAHRGGPRNPTFLHNHLVVHGTTSLPIVLFDDVLTSGSHMSAARRKLLSYGLEVERSIVIAKVTHIQECDVMAWKSEDFQLP